MFLVNYFMLWFLFCLFKFISFAAWAPNFNMHTTDPRSESSGYVFVRIQGGFHEIRNSVRVKCSSCIICYRCVTKLIWLPSLVDFQICDVVVISRLLNATLVIPEIQSTTRSKGIRWLLFCDTLIKFISMAKLI